MKCLEVHKLMNGIITVWYIYTMEHYFTMKEMKLWILGTGFESLEIGF